MNKAASAGTRSFNRSLDRWLLDVVDEVDSFDELVLKLPGVYPPVAAAALDRLVSAGGISPSTHRVCLRRAVSRTSRPSAVAERLPPPHPLDFDWRYAPDSINLLIDLIERRSNPGGTVVMIGTPTLYVAVHDRRIDREFVLIDANGTTVDRIRALGLGQGVRQSDVFAGDLPALGASVVIADPPWYPEHIDAFLWAASTCSAPGSSVLMSLPARGTRPGIRGERGAFRASAARHGLAVSRTESGVLPYVSPPFEVNALRAAGWADLPPDWRRGDLVELRRHGVAGGVPACPARQAQWDERPLGQARVRIRRGGNAIGAPHLIPLVAGDVLSDVSRRHPIRAQVDVWTSGNRVFRCASPALLLGIVDALASGSDPIRAAVATIGRGLVGPEEANIAKAVSQLEQLNRTEDQELAGLGWPGKTESPYGMRR